MNYAYISCVGYFLFDIFVFLLHIALCIIHVLAHTLYIRILNDITYIIVPYMQLYNIILFFAKLITIGIIPNVVMHIPY